MKPIQTILIILLFCSINISAQEPALLSLQGFGGDRYDAFNYATKTSDNGVIVLLTSSSNSGTGNINDACTNNHNSQNIYRKYNTDLTVKEWSKCFERSGDSSFSYMFPTTNNSLVLGGNFISNAGWGYNFAKLDANDNLVWQKNYSKGNGAILRDMIKADNGGYLVLGESFNIDTNVLVHYGGALSTDIWLLKLNDNGNKEWSVVLGSSDDDKASTILNAPNGFYVIGTAGGTDYDCIENHGSSDLFVAHLDYSGNIIWKHCYGGSLADGGASACVDKSGGLIILAGSSSSDGDVNNHIVGVNAWILHIDSNGNILWSNCYGGGGQENVQRICEATDGSIWAIMRFNKSGGQIATNYGSEDIWVLHIDENGNYLSSKVLGSQYEDFVSMLCPLSNNTVIVGGTYNKANGSFSGLSKYDDNIGDAFLAVFAPWTTEVQEHSKILNPISIYPNPAKEELHIQLNEKKRISKYRLVITDVLGKPVLKKIITETETISVQSWSRGMYTVQISGKDGLKYSEKICLQ